MKNININLLKALVDTDFPVLLSSKTNNKRANSQPTSMALNTSERFSGAVSLDILTLIKSLKQTIRLFQFVKNDSKNCLQICTTNRQYLNLLNEYISKESFNNKATVKSVLTKNSLQQNASQLLLLLDEPLGNNNKIFKRLAEDKVYLISKINSKFEKNSWGTYKIYNDLSDFKKLIFLITLLRQTL
jgi:hypothetical protein